MARVYNSRERILMTGGAGFLGSHLIDRLLSDMKSFAWTTSSRGPSATSSTFIQILASNSCATM